MSGANHGWHRTNNDNALYDDEAKMVERDPFDFDDAPSDMHIPRVARGPRRPLTSADYDLSTGLINRQAFHDRLNESVKYHRSHRESFALLILQIQDLDAMIDLYGHGAAEQVISQYAKLLRTGVRSSDTVARIDDDRFAVILDGILDQSKVIGVVERVRKRLGKPIMTKGALIPVLSDMGFALYPEDGIEAREVQDHAERSLKDAKEARISKTPARRLQSVG